MDIRDEKSLVYKQMKLLMEERRELSKQYYDLKEYLIHLENQKNVSIEQKLTFQEKKPLNLQSEKVIQDYFIHRKALGNHQRSYKDYGLIIASILKESGKPLASKQLYQELVKKNDILPGYRNFVNNILPKINRDKSISVERAMRGYWQYRNIP